MNHISSTDIFVFVIINGSNMYKHG